MTKDGLTPHVLSGNGLCGSLVGRCPNELQRLAKRGWRLFPCKPRDKTPRVKWGTQATSDLPTIRAWWEQYPGCNWAVACGPDSGLWVLDVDGTEGAASLNALWQEYGGGSLNTLTALTARGSHFYFTHPPQLTIRSTAGQLGQGLDTRGDGGYVIVPPSIHPSGHHYRWRKPDVPMASAPSWLVSKIASPKRVPTLAVQIGVLLEGQRNNGLMRLAGQQRRKGATCEQIETALFAANLRQCSPPLDDAEVRKIAASAAGYPIGGPDPLERAWEAIRELVFPSRYEQFLGLAHQLQLSRPGQTIFLPLKRVGALMGCHFNQISRYRLRATEEGRLKVVERYVAHKKSTLFIYSDTVELETVELELEAVELEAVKLLNTNSGLVLHPSPSPGKGVRDRPDEAVGKVDTNSLMIEGRI